MFRVLFTTPPPSSSTSVERSLLFSSIKSPKYSQSLCASLPVPALLAGRGVSVHQSSELKQGEFLQQDELGDRLVLHCWTGRQGGQALLAGPVQPLAHSAEHTTVSRSAQMSTHGDTLRSPSGTNYIIVVHF